MLAHASGVTQILPSCHPHEVNPSFLLVEKSMSKSISVGSEDSSELWRHFKQSIA